MLGFFCIMLRMKSLAAGEKHRSERQKLPDSGDVPPPPPPSSLPESEMLSQKGESKSYCAFMILEKSLDSLSS